VKSKVGKQNIKFSIYEVLLCIGLIHLILFYLKMYLLHYKTVRCLRTC